MSSGTYFPPPVRAVEIPKPHGGGTRVLGVPTVADRIAQTVAALTLEPRTESIFHDDSYGYRPGRSPLMAVAKCRQRCWTRAWVIDLDVAKFFDSVDHELMVKAVQANITPEQKWVVLYVKRWLTAPIRMPDGKVVERNRGTPQGSAVSPVLANLFMQPGSDGALLRRRPLRTVHATYHRTRLKQAARALRVDVLASRAGGLLARVGRRRVSSGFVCCPVCHACPGGSGVQRRSLCGSGSATSVPTHVGIVVADLG
jgi:group II intron reverse transcriptase/maturase